MIEKKLTKPSIIRLILFGCIVVGTATAFLTFIATFKDLVAPMSKYFSHETTTDNSFLLIVKFFLDILIGSFSIGLFFIITLQMAIVLLVPILILRLVGLRRKLSSSVTKTEYVISRCIFYGTMPAIVVVAMIIWEFVYIPLILIIVASWYSILLIYLLGVRKRVKDNMISTQNPEHVFMN